MSGVVPERKKPPATHSALEGLGVLSDEVIRHRFEHWQTAGDSRNLPAIQRSGEGYKLMQTQSAWTAWKAAAQNLGAAGVGASDLGACDAAQQGDKQ